MATALEPRIALTHGFADAVPEMATPWKARTPPAARLLALNERLAVELGLSPELLRTDAGIAFLTGIDVPEGAVPVAQAYSGHQFGGFSPHLGDGRALLLGEAGHADGSVRDIHLKGSGRTPYSRGGDGFAAVGPMLREYLISEAMFALGIRTTRSLAVTATGGEVERETVLPGAVLTRIASSHLRVGSFQYARGVGIPGLLERLTDHAIARHRPAAAGAPIPALELLRATIASQADLIARWMLVGFVHGVMNTDNMTISGETIDYGPCAFIDAYDPAAVYSSIDTQGRYAYGNQPMIAEWNLARLAESLLPLLDPDQDRAVELAQEALAEFAPTYNVAWAAGMRQKLGLPDTVANEEVARLGAAFLEILRAEGADFTSSFRALAASLRGDVDPLVGVGVGAGASGAFDAWLDGWRMLQPDPTRMDAANPLYIPRNHLVEEALTAASSGDLALFEQLLAAVTEPFQEKRGAERFAEPAPPDFGAYRTFCGT